jgi:tetratricopeptide (TPR) repeat protein
LEKALQISPEYAVSHSNLGAQYLKMGKPREAQAEIARAIEIAGPNPSDLGNLAFAHLAQEHIAEAMDAARQALKMQKNHPAAHYVLGITLILAPATRGEGMAHLEEAAKTLESARRAIAAIEQLRQQ